ncbi:tryptase beta-2-like isoform X2 [Takifugu flavidus]|uniref:tryptase beta-2-like isoform X2 n=1 Tax=Takifugu flavidus TaxID=433684 RepID=UPI0025440CF1|nr:tryptase beta-2-like isoform X2 [Takifugu flavidus]
MRFYQVLVVVVALSEGAGAQPGNMGGPERLPWYAKMNGAIPNRGTLISDQWVLTDAFFLSLIYNKGLTVELGQPQRTGSDPVPVSRGVSEAVYHPLFDPQNYQQSIALLKLSSPVNLSDHISSICLAPANSTFQSGTDAWILGLSSNVMAKASILENNECQTGSNQTRDDLICTGNYSLPSGTCMDTVGSPLLVTDGKMWIQIGVGSTSICGEKKRPLLSVSSHLEWIRNVTGNSQLGEGVSTSTSSPGDGGVSTSTSSPGDGGVSTSTSSPGGGGVSTSTSSPGDGGVSTSTSSPGDGGVSTSTSSPQQCTTPPVEPPRTKCDRSIFGSSQKLSATHFTSVCALLFSLYVLVVQA